MCALVIIIEKYFSYLNECFSENVIYFIVHLDLKRKSTIQFVYDK